jgi:hypothetical protein
VRAWRPLDLALVKPEVFFVNDGDTKQLQLHLSQFSGVAVSSAVAPSPPIVGEPVNLVVQVVQQSVDPEGVVRGEAIGNVRVELFGGGDWSVLTGNPTITNSQGRAQWELRCRSPGRQPLSVVVGDSQQFPLELPACESAPPETTTTSSSTPDSTSTSGPPTSR